MVNSKNKSLGVSVNSAARLCLELFASAIRSCAPALDSENKLDEIRSPTEHRQLRNERDRFRIWAANAAAFAEGRQSLDYRLRELPEELDLVRSLLGTISSRLESYELALSKDGESIDGENWEAGLQSKVIETTPTATASEETEKNIGSNENANTPRPGYKPEPSMYEEALDFISRSIDWLHRLSNMLRKASVINQSLRAQSYEPPDIDVCSLNKFFGWLICREFPGLSEQLKGRLANTMVERHRRVLYRRHRHGSGWKQQEGYHCEKQQLEPSQTIQEGPLSQSNKHPVTLPVTKESLADQPLPISAPDAATEPNRSRYYASSSVSVARSGALNHDAEMILPPPPNACKTRPEFTCNLCYMILKSQIGRDPILWSEHVKQDLDAYVCLFDGCERPTDIFATSKEWVLHMQSEHLVKWACPVVDHHDAVEFGTKEELMGHMTESHAGNFRSELLPHMAEGCRTASELVFDACPFCGQNVGTIEQHIGHHLRYLALKSIPLPEDDLHAIEGTSEIESLASKGELDRETIGQCFGSFTHGSISFSNENDSISTEYGGTSTFFDLPEQRKFPRPELDEREERQDRQAEWGFILEIFAQHQEWKNVQATVRYSFPPITSRSWAFGALIGIFTRIYE